MLPGWDSLEITSTLAKWFTNFGFAALFLLCVFEVLGHAYSVRETTLRESRLRAAFGDRRLNLAQQMHLKSIAAKFKGSKVWLHSYPNDVEAASLIVDLRAALEPELYVEDQTGNPSPPNDPPTPLPVFGITVMPSPDKALGTALIEALRKEGLLVSYAVYASVSEQTQVFVGTKPLGSVP